MKRIVVCLLLMYVLTVSAQRVTVSHPHGFYAEPFRLTMKVADVTNAGSYRIRYTTDGSEPTEESSLYTSPFTIDGNTVIRAVAISPDNDERPTLTATYLFADDVMRQPDNPTGYPSQWGSFCEITGTAPADYGMDQTMALDELLAPHIRDGLTAIPTLSLVTDKDHFFSHQRDPQTGGIYIFTGTPVGDGVGRDWERPVSMEIFGGQQHYDITVDCGVKIHGGHSRLPEKTPKHSLRLMFKSQYGPAKLNYYLFGEDGPKKFNQLVLRSMFGHTWLHWDNSNRRYAQYERDMWARTVQGLAGHPSSRGQYVHLFINGLYWGLYNIAERIDDDYCTSNYGGEEGDYDVIKVEEDHAGHTIYASDGNLSAWNRMVRLAAQAATSNDAYAQLIGTDASGQLDTQAEPLLDVDNFIDFMLINQYAANSDWDHHNWIAFRNRERATQGFQFICWDSEMIFEGLNNSNLDLNNAGAPTYVFNSLMKNRNFLRRYADRAYWLLEAPGGWLTPEKVVEVWDSLYHIIELPLYDEAARWGDYRRDIHPYQTRGEYYTVDNQYMTERNRLLKNYFPDRTNVFINQLKTRGWYIEIEPPQFRINRETENLPHVLTYDDIVGFKTSHIVYYTLDGTEPVSWMQSANGTVSPSAHRFGSGDNILDYVDWTNTRLLTVKAVSKSGNQWSPVVERTFLLDQTTSIASIPSSSLPSTAIYDLSGRPLPPTAPLRPGIYIHNGKKFLVR